jgi:hypothetical protein
MSSVSLINGHIDDDNYVGDITHNVYVKVVEEAEQMLFKTIKRIGNEYKLSFLVDKSKVIEALTDYQRKINGTADLVEVVFCKDCKHTIINEKHKDKPLICVKTKMCGTTNPLFYCAAGERRDKKNDKL